MLVLGVHVMLTSCLHEERQDIARHEDLGEPAQFDERVVRAIAQRDDSAQLHVYGGSKQGGSDQDEQNLDNVGTLGPIGRLICRYSATNVSDPFNCISVNQGTLQMTCRVTYKGLQRAWGS